MSGVKKLKIMGKEITYEGLRKKYQKFNMDQIKNLLEDLKNQLDVADRTTSEAFQILNESSNNLKFAILQELLEEKAKDSIV